VWRDGLPQSSDMSNGTLRPGVESCLFPREGWSVMAESEKAKASRLAQAREKRRRKREETGDTPEAQAERRKAATTAAEYDAETMKNRVGNPGATFFS
jgi:hypothetical protein